VQILGEHQPGQAQPGGKALGGGPGVYHSLGGERLHRAHSKDARAIGETEQRLYALNAWRETGFFDARERAALAFCEAVVRMVDTHVPREAFDEVAAVFSEKETAALICLIVSINAWNAVGVSTHTWEPGTYEG
jgi:alkylhydroperoxidase family enzyme